MSEAALETQDLSMSFGALRIANNINFRLEPGARHALIGPNGAGKTTFVNLVTGGLQPSAGRILMDGHDITHLPQAQRVKRGLARTFQITTLFRGLSVLENVTLVVGERHGVAGDILRPAGSRGADEALRPVKELPYGRQGRVEIAVALGLAPKVLLLDEPAAGVPSAETGMIIEMIERLPPEIAVLIIEHDMDLVFRLARRITVLVQGAVLVEGPPQQIAADQRVRQVYLGEREHA